MNLREAIARISEISAQAATVKPAGTKVTPPNIAQMKVGYFVVFIPGLLFISLALTLLLAPQLVLGIVAGMFFIFGLLVCIAGWKLIQMKHRVENMAQQLRGKVIIQGMSVGPDLFGVEPEEITKKTVFH